jgi:hypothetical protein
MTKPKQDPAQAPVLPTCDAAERKRRETMAGVKVAIAHEQLQAAREALDAACRALSPVIGANNVFREIAILSDGCKLARLKLAERYETAQPFALLYDRDASEAEINAAEKSRGE